MTYQKAITDTPVIEIRRATLADRPALEEMKEQAMSTLLDPLMTPEQRHEMRQITPYDPALIEDGTYYVATVNGWIAASGGWSRRAALFSPDGHDTGEAPFLDPKCDAASIRAMYTHPDFARKGLGSLVLSTALAAARFAGFRQARLLATVAGERLYRAAGWRTEERVMVGSGDKAIVPGYRMSRSI
ncbi:GNAT family N-acetyltransferase [Roseobacter sinensis]|uniref:GNAT family N-acetyltransferase n=1 Tax=Roseobacter sinensis TaxID=2931391 RepID=A0ABT3BJY8_9RHOB|nr:GNAT family N-acetyltransferase [Roseobacter sp. WL0113]MCV3273889.1 GNAT family N-acetyltransferase [Roseobacter sp. WL0113]